MLVDRSYDLAIAAALFALTTLGCSDTDYGSVKAHRGDAGTISNGGDGGGADDGGGGAGGSAEGGAPSIDAGIDLDGATMDAAVLGLDGGLNLPPGTLILPDHTILLPDGEVIDVDTAVDRYAPEIEVSKCSLVDEGELSIQVDFPDENGFSIVPGLVGFNLAYSTINTGACATNVALMTIPGSTGFGESRALLEACNRVGDVTLAPRTDGFQVAWVDNSTNSDELHTAGLDNALEETDPVSRAQVNPTDEADEPEVKPALTEVDGRMIAVWVTRGVLGPDSISSRVLGTDDIEVNTLVDAIAEFRIHGLSLATMGTEAAALTWVDTEGSHPGIWLLKLDKNGAPAGDAIQLAMTTGPDAAVSVASRPGGGGAVVYSTEIEGVKQIAFRSLDALGDPTADDRERILIGPPLRGEGASLQTLGGSYAVLFRALPGSTGAMQSPEIRLLIVRKDGAVDSDDAGHVLTTRIAPCQDGSGRTSVAVSNEGGFMVGWTDADDADPKYKSLKLVRRRLSCL